MNSFKNKLAYMQLRMRHFQNKKVTDLTDEELQEFMELRNEFTKEIKPAVTKTWNRIKKILLEGGE